MFLDQLCIFFCADDAMRWVDECVWCVVHLSDSDMVMFRVLWEAYTCAFLSDRAGSVVGLWQVAFWCFFCACQIRPSMCQPAMVLFSEYLELLPVGISLRLDWYMLHSLQLISRLLCTVCGGDRFLIAAPVTSCREHLPRRTRIAVLFVPHKVMEGKVLVKRYSHYHLLSSGWMGCCLLLQICWKGVVCAPLNSVYSRSLYWFFCGWTIFYVSRKPFFN